jgi:hypothetical protein
MASAQPNAEKVKEYHDEPQEPSSPSSSPTSSPAGSSSSSSDDDNENVPKPTDDMPRCSKKLRKQVITNFSLANH